MAQLASTADRLIVICGSPGMIRGGQRNPLVASYPLDHFTSAQLEDLASDPDIRLAVGHLLNVDEAAEAMATALAVAERDRDALSVRELGGHTIQSGEFVPGAGVLGEVMPAVGRPIPAAADVASAEPLGPEMVESDDGKPVPVASGEAEETGLQRRRRTAR